MEVLMNDKRKAYEEKYDAQLKEWNTQIALLKAKTDLQLDAEILSYSRSRGLFAGVALNGAILRPDKDTNTELYGDKVTNREIVTGTKTRESEAGTNLTMVMNKYSIQNK
jgi:lipid-binding SYLF domain-containing protein